MEFQHYRAYRPAPFMRDERDHVEILFGGLNWRAERLLQAVFENMGYRARPLPPVTRQDLLTGRELADIGQCCPTSFTTGNLANFLRGESERIGRDALVRNHIYVTAGACGSCRFGQYHQSYELALRSLGLEQFRLFLIAQDRLDQDATAGGGLELNMPLTIGAVWAIWCADVLQGIEYKTRPYERHKGQTDEVVKESVESLYRVFRDRPYRGKKLGSLAWHILTPYFTNALRTIFKKFESIEVDRLQPKPVVKITGEFYLQTVEGEPNHNIHRWLESEGAEVYPAPVAVWLDYLIRLRIQRQEDYVGIDPAARIKLIGLRALQRLYRHGYDRLRTALGGLPHALPRQEELRRLAEPFFGSRLHGGEGDMLIGKAIWAYVHRKAHLICELSPYACMPNTMSVGAMAGVLGKYPGLLYAPLEIKGDAEIHALSRCQMMLSEAKKRAYAEYESALNRCGMREDDARTLAARTPVTNLATHRVPHSGFACTAANTVVDLASRGTV